MYYKDTSFHLLRRVSIHLCAFIFSIFLAKDKPAIWAWRRLVRHCSIRRPVALWTYYLFYHFILLLRPLYAPAVMKGLLSLNLNSPSGHPLISSMTASPFLSSDAIVAFSSAKEGIFPLAFLISLRDRKSTRLNSSHGYISYAV